MPFMPALSTVAETIQIALAPVFLLTGIGGILNVLTGRLSRVVDRARALERLHPTTSGPEHDHHVWELQLLDRRMKVINAALLLCVASAMSICLVVASLFVAQLADWHFGQFVAIAFIVAMALLMSGLVLFMVEVRMSLRATHFRNVLATRREG